MAHGSGLPTILRSGLAAAALFAALPAAADPGPGCTLATPAANAQCGTITMAIVGRTNSLDPANGGPNTDYQPAYPQQGLLYRQDQNLVPRMDLIEAETVSADGLTITQIIRKGAKYSDGSPVLAEDGVLAYTRWKASGISSAYVAKIIGAKAEGADRIVWTLSTPYPDFKYALASQFMAIHPKVQIDAKGAAEASVDSLLTIVLPDMAAAFTPMVYAIPVQLLAYHTAVIMGTDVDQPRNLAKSVTVE